MRTKGKGLSKLSQLDKVEDTGKGRRGYLAVNIVNDIKFKAKQRGKFWKLDNIEAFKLITSSCTYCGFIPEWPKNRVGIDRVDNSIGYVPSNCVPCCFTCNSAKKELTLEQFKEWLKNAYNKTILGSASQR